MKKVIMFVLIAALCFGMAGCGGGDNTPIKDSEISSLYSNPKDFKGRTFEFAGKVFSVEKDGEGYAIQAWGDTVNNQENTIIYTTSTDPKIKNDDFIIATGTITGEFKGENAFGGEVKAPKMETTSIKVATYQEAVAPALKTITPENATLTKGKVTLTVSKVEIAESETRVYVSAKNDSSGEVSLWTHSATLLQNGKQLDPQDNYDADYPQMSSEIKKGVSTEGIICFPVIEEGAFSFAIDGSDPDYNELKFNIKITPQ